MLQSTPVAIIGSGPAGFTAAIYASRAMLTPVVFKGLQPGGQLTSTTEVENYPGFAEPLQGPWLMEQMESQARELGTVILQEQIVEVDFGIYPFRLTDDSGRSYAAQAVIVATGAQARWLGIPGEDEFRGFGVSACATCDGFFYRQKKVMVVGGGNTALEEALFLTNFATEVILVHRRDAFRAERVLQKRLFAHPKIKVMWNSVLESIRGDNAPRGVTAAVIRDVTTSRITEVGVDGVFVAIGHTPSSDLFKGQLDMTPTGYIVTDLRSTATSVPGIFAAGDVSDDVYRQAVTAAGMGCMAALDAERFLAGLLQKDRVYESV